MDQRTVTCGDVSVTLKSTYPRLLKNLTMAFVMAFSAFTDVLCSTFPHRREELNHYLAYTIELAVRYGGTILYDYHKSFSAKAAAVLGTDNIVINWARPDIDLFHRIFGGRREYACGVCSSTSHSTHLCPKTAAAGPSSSSRFPPFSPNFHY
ncbi:hypothetical protein EOD39_11300 [Acipenser ruthenus]|uniref:Uncharacterized protein n=1 Tax=Acipenser ruthenus TaxID=7906 RepID=A0A444UPC1_ACIRT|nr:hypothetical protein EOD39_11300 [Acipenser ruthenus]